MSTWADRMNKALMEIRQRGIQNRPTTSRILSARDLASAYMRPEQMKRKFPTGVPIRTDSLPHWLNPTLPPGEARRREELDKQVRDMNERAKKYGGQTYSQMHDQIAHSRQLQVNKLQDALNRRLQERRSAAQEAAFQKARDELGKRYTKGIEGFEERQDILRGTGGLRVTPTTIGGLSPYVKPLKEGEDVTFSVPREDLIESFKGEGKRVRQLLQAQRSQARAAGMARDPYYKNPWPGGVTQEEVDNYLAGSTGQTGSITRHIDPKDLPVLWQRRQDPMLAGLLQKDIDMRSWSDPNDPNSGLKRIDPQTGKVISQTPWQHAMREMSGLPGLLMGIGGRGDPVTDYGQVSGLRDYDSMFDVKYGGKLLGQPAYDGNIDPVTGKPQIIPGGNFGKSYMMEGGEGPTGLLFGRFYNPSAAAVNAQALRGLNIGQDVPQDIKNRLVPEYDIASRFRRGPIETWDPATRWRYLRTALNPQNLDIYGKSYGYTGAPVDYWSPGMELQQEAAGMQNPVWNPQLNQYVEDPSQYGPVQSGQPMAFMDYWAAKQAGTLPQAAPVQQGIKGMLGGIGGIGGLSGPPSQPTYSPELTKSFYGFRAPMMEQMGTPYQGLQQQITSLKGTGHPIYG